MGRNASRIWWVQGFALCVVLLLTPVLAFPSTPAAQKIQVVIGVPEAEDDHLASQHARVLVPASADVPVTVIGPYISFPHS